MSINVGRGGATHDIALARACELQLDVLLVQEPWWSERTKSHPFFDCHVPFAKDDARPRAVTYTRKDNLQVNAKQTFLSQPTGDYCLVNINGIAFLNVYKAPHDSSAVLALLNWTPPPWSVIAGDFNSVHWAWQPGTTHSYGQGEEIESWAERHNLSCLIIGEPTHRAGNTLDLVWTNIGGTNAWVARDECMTSDHLPICGSVPCRNWVPSKNKCQIRVTKDKLPKFAQVVAQWLPPLSTLDSIEKIEKSASDLCKVLKEAIQATGTPINRGRGKSAPWWTPECKFARLNYQEATSEAERKIRAKSYRAVVASSKREYWKRQVEVMNSSSDVFKLMHWASPRQSKIPPPLIHEERIISDQAERATILRDCLLARFESSDDLPPCTFPGEDRIPWKEELTETEVRICTIGSGNTCPGADGISTELLTACWDSIGSFVTNLFRACLRFGHHPSCFKLAEIVFLPKKKRDLTKADGWRPISLLSCIGKGLERVIAKRMSYLAITSDVVGRQQFGALPKRSANDLVSCVVHDIEEARCQGWASTLITLDVKGAFDSVLHNRLLWRMQAQGWPDMILRWTRSFLMNRSVQVKYPGGVTSPKGLVCGVPQGSPISPLLFLLYMAEPMRSGNLRTRFSYADDLGILGIGRTIAESAIAAQQEVDSLLRWANNNAVSFDSKKTEVIQFNGRHREDPVSVRVNNVLVEPAERIRWLGIHIDHRLTFRQHVEIWCAKALNTANHMRRLNPVNRGAAPGPLVQAVEACIASVAIYGADVWWPGITRPTARGFVTPPTTYHCGLIDKAVHLALRSALPVWRTTPNVVLHRESGIPPARIMLESNRLRLAARINSLDDRHPLRSRACVCPNIGTLKYKRKPKLSKRPETQMSRIQRCYAQLPPAEAAEPLSAPVYTDNLGTKSEGVEAHVQWVRTISAEDICAFSDGSSEGHGRSSWGFVLQRNGRTFQKDQGILHGGEVYDAELMGATMALLAAIQVRQSGEKIFILLDNQAAVRALQTGQTSSCIKLTQAFFDVVTKTNAEVRWVPGHSKIRGNEEADAAARSALKSLPNRQTEPGRITLAYLRRLMFQRRQNLVNEWWSKACPDRYRDLDLQMRRRKPPELALPRRLLHKLIAARTGHGDFAAYHRRFHHSDANLECTCGLETSPTHFIRCRQYATQVRRLRKGASMGDFISQLLGPKCLDKFLEFTQKTGCFKSL